MIWPQLETLNFALRRRKLDFEWLIPEPETDEIREIIAVRTFYRDTKVVFSSDISNWSKVFEHDSLYLHFTPRNGNIIRNGDSAIHLQRNGNLKTRSSRVC